jgi:cardiolipin synthase
VDNTLTKFSLTNQLDLLVCGQEFFPALIAALDAAQSDVYFETYIFSHDETGVAVRDALAKARARGVTVNVIVDWAGTGRKQTRVLRAFFKTHGVNFKTFNPGFRRGWVRSHRKLCVVDRQIAFVGGINVNNDMMQDHKPFHPLPHPRWDFAVQIKGPLVADVYKAMLKQWVTLNGISLQSRLKVLRDNWLAPELIDEGEMKAGFVVRDNVYHRERIETVLLRAVARAKDKVILVAPYFAPDKKLRKGLEEAALRGVNITLVIGVGEMPVQDAITCFYYAQMLKAGVKIVEYRYTQLHAKVVIVDDNWATVGSSNYDGFSLFINQEANVVVTDTAFIADLLDEVTIGMNHGQEVKLSDYLSKSWIKRTWYHMAFQLYRLCIGILGRHVR